MQGAAGSAIGAGAGNETLQNNSFDGPSKGKTLSADGFRSMPGLMINRSPGGYSRACNLSRAYAAASALLYTADA